MRLHSVVSDRHFRRELALRAAEATVRSGLATVLAAG